MTKQYGFAKLGAQIADYLVSEWECRTEENDGMPGDTPIEKLLFAALLKRCEIGACEFSPPFIASSLEKVEQLLAEEGPYEVRLVVWPQAEIDGRRVDFYIFTNNFQNKGELHRLIVECDGHNFHERTKEQAARDRQKDRAAVMSGIQTFRFTGSEIWRDPWGCAEQITDWAARAFYG